MTAYAQAFFAINTTALIDIINVIDDLECVYKGNELGDDVMTWTIQELRKLTDLCQWYSAIGQECILAD